MRGCLQPYFSLLLAAAAAYAIVPTIEARSQTTSSEFWPEIDLVYHFDNQTKVIGLADVNRNRDSGTSYQREFGLALDHAFTEWTSARIGYRHANATDGGPFLEDRLLAEETFRVSLPARVIVDFRTREDLRWLNTGFSARLRERIQISREARIGSYAFTPYASAEIYFDTRYGQFSRYRLIVGSNLPVYGPLSVEPYLARQVDYGPTDGIANVFGLILIATL